MKKGRAEDEEEGRTQVLQRQARQMAMASDRCQWGDRLRIFSRIRFSTEGRAERRADDQGIVELAEMSDQEQQAPEKPVETYYVVYKVESHPDGITKEELTDPKEGVCDSLLQVIMAHDKNHGRKHYAIMSMDGEKNEMLHIREQWEAWAVFTRFLARNIDPNNVEYGWMGQICNGAVEVLTAIKGNKIVKKIDTGLVDASGGKIQR